jgi:hypothetical protein
MIDAGRRRDFTIIAGELDRIRVAWPQHQQ